MFFNMPESKMYFECPTSICVQSVNATQHLAMHEETTNHIVLLSYFRSSNIRFREHLVKLKLLELIRSRAFCCKF